jgi:hypothetical protein
LDTRFHDDDQRGHTVEAAPNRRANGRALLFPQAQLSVPQESVTALRKLRMKTPGLQAGATRDLARRLVRQAGLIECDPALAVCAKLLTIEIFFTVNG